MFLPFVRQMKGGEVLIYNGKRLDFFAIAFARQTHRDKGNLLVGQACWGTRLGSTGEQGSASCERRDYRRRQAPLQ